MKTKFLIGLLILILTAILLNSYFIIENFEGDKPQIISELIDHLKECSDEANFVIEKENLTEIRKCETEEYVFNGEDIYYVHIVYGPKMGCDLGVCNYQGFIGVLFSGGDIEEIIPKEDAIDKVLTWVWAEHKIPLTREEHLKGISDISIVRYSGKLIWKFSFDNNIKGEAYVYGGHIDIGNTTDITTTQTIQGGGDVFGQVTSNIDILDAVNIANSKIIEEGYVVKLPVEYSDNVVTGSLGRCYDDKPCWKWVFISQDPDAKCYVFVYLDGSSKIGECKYRK
ncbi:hypothetical protein HYT51_01765 [Candidatus Woesearchaeota archaeon]|nr:hypothetical protein [Candidatus Woesearchaeota archaeon]